MMRDALLRVRIGDAEAAVSLDRVDEIVRMVALEPVPGGAKLVRGAMNLRGEIVVVVDVASLLGQRELAGDPDHYIVVIRGERGRYGIICTDTLDVADVDATRRRELSGWGGNSYACELVHVDGRLIPLLDPEAMSTHAA
jgi:purine-binding chemotaxis protein CheW